MTDMTSLPVSVRPQQVELEALLRDIHARRREFEALFGATIPSAAR